MLCDYGCGKEGVYKLRAKGNILKYCCSEVWQRCEGSKEKLKNNGQKLWMSKEFRNNRKQWNKGLKGEYGKYARLSNEELFCKNSNVKTDFLKNIVLARKLKEYKCIKCGNVGLWMNEPLTLQLHHHDGDRTNALLENLDFECPNCHTQTGNYAGKALKKEKIYISKTKNYPVKKCDICSGTTRGLAIHLIRSHDIIPKDYYDKFLKKEGDGTCLNCGGETRFGSLKDGYLKSCSEKCGLFIRARNRREIITIDN